MTALKTLAVMAVMTIAPLDAPAQSATFAGRVTTAAGMPLGGANVRIPDAGIGAITDSAGKYSFNVAVERMAGRNLTIVARYIGYKPQRLPVTLAPGRSDHNFTLERDVLHLEAVIVTGTSAATSQKMTPFSVAVIDDVQIKQVPSTSPLGALAGRVAGASFLTPSGQPGSTPRIRLRAATSLVASADPMVIIDGTITRLSLADINSEDIERVEIIKGAAASSLYGSDAANGVVQIFTKRNANLADGQTTFTLRNEFGQNSLRDVVPGSMRHHFQVQCGAAACNPADASSTKVTGYVLDATGNRVDEPDLIADNRYPAYNDPLRALFKPGRFSTTYGSFGQRRGNSNFKVSFQNHRDEGTVARLHGYSRQNFRINADQALAENFDASVGAFYARSRADEPEGFPNRVFFAARTVEPDLKIDSTAVDCPSTIPDCTWKGSLSPAFLNRGTNPLYALEQERATRDRTRFTGTFSARYRPLTWLTGEASIGYDASNEKQHSFTPYGFVFPNFTTGKGRLNHRASGDRAYNANVTLSSSRNLTGSIRNTSKAAFVYEDQTHDFASIDAAQLLVPHVDKLSAADPSQLTTSSRSETIRASNSYFVTTFEIKDRYILDGLARRDESSLFGSSERSQIYYRASAAWRVTEDFRIPLLDELKLRASHGTAGLRPPYVAQYEVFTIVGGNPEKVTAGNPQLKPAFSRETEYGFNLSAFRNYSVEYNYSTKTTTDQILNVPLSSTTGYVSQWQNVGTLAGRTHELVVGAVLLSKADYLWRVNISADRTRQKVTELKTTPFDIAGYLRIAPGETYGAVYGSRMIRTLAELKETLKTGRLLGGEGDYVVNEDGFYVRKSEYRTRAEVPLVHWTCGAGDSTCAYARATTRVRLGDVNPDFGLGFNTLAQWRSLSATAMLVWAKGGHIYNNTRRAGLQGHTTDAAFDQSAKPDPGSCPALTLDPNCPYKTGRKPVTYYTQFTSSDAFFFESASYVKLRELALNWELPKGLVAGIPVGEIRTARLGIVGRNLWTKTRYTGYDPDVALVGADTPFLNRRDNWSYPPYRTFTAMLELGF